MPSSEKTRRVLPGSPTAAPEIRIGSLPPCICLPLDSEFFIYFPLSAKLPTVSYTAAPPLQRGGGAARAPLPRPLHRCEVMLPGSHPLQQNDPCTGTWRTFAPATAQAKTIQAL